MVNYKARMPLSLCRCSRLARCHQHRTPLGGALSAHRDPLGGALLAMDDFLAMEFNGFGSPFAENLPAPSRLLATRSLLQEELIVWPKCRVVAHWTSICTFRDRLHVVLRLVLVHG